MIYSTPINHGSFKNYKTETKTKLLLYHLLKLMGKNCETLTLVMEWDLQEEEKEPVSLSSIPWRLTFLAASKH